MANLRDLIKAKPLAKPEVAAPVLFYPRLQISYSSLELFNTCERKYQLTKLLEGPDKTEDSPYFSRGHCLETAIQYYILTGDYDYAYFMAWLAYWPELEEPAKNITQSSTLYIFSLIRDQLDILRDEWEIATFQNKPAIQLSFSLTIGADYIYVGFIDIVLRHKITGIYAIAEIKTTTNNTLDVDPLFKNSTQAVMYSSVLDQIAGEELSKYQVLYFIIQDVQGKIKFHIKVYQKTLIDRLNAFLSIGLDVQRITACETLGVYPKRGSKCMAYKRTCAYFETCGLQGADRPKVREESKVEYQFQFQLETIVQDHIRRVSNAR